MTQAETRTETESKKASERAREGREGNFLRELWRKARENIFLLALPYAVLISSLTIIGMFFGYELAVGRSEMLRALIAFSLSMLGIVSGVISSYIVVRVKYG